MQISQELFELLFLTMIGCCVVVVCVLLPSWLMLSIFTPKKLLERFFKEPHFTKGELVMMAGFPFFMIRTVMFGWSTIFPQSGKKRKIFETGKYMPSWYKFLLRTVTLGTTGLTLVVLAIIVCSFIFQPVP